MVDARLSRALPLFLAGGAGHRNDLRVAQHWVVAQPARDLEAIHSRQRQIQENHVRPETPRRVEARDPVVGEIDLVSEVLAKGAERVRGIDVVIDDQDAESARLANSCYGSTS
jgi:hypothetical protein